MNKYKQLIEKLLTIKDEMKKIDTEAIWEYYSPELPCNDADIDVVEHTLNIKLDDEYTSFLLCANGWKCFYQAVDLFGTNELLSEKMEAAKFILDLELEYNDILFNIKDRLLPIAHSREDKDLFVIVIGEGTNAGKVIWFAGGVIDEFESFYDFFDSMIEYERSTFEYTIENVYKK